MTPGRGAITFESTLEIGEGGVVAEDVDETESKLPVDEYEPPLEDFGLIEELECLLRQL